MSPQFIMEIGRDTILTTLWIAGPILAVGFVVGIVISLLQAVLQLHEATLAYVPKLFAIAATLLFCGHWMLQSTMNFTQKFLGGFAHFVGH
jgi:flagellar biosynthetic protein FliQ